MGVVLFTVLALVLALGVWGVVGMGMAGKGRVKYPKLAHHFARAAQALNGDSEPPARWAKLFH